jgi:hypothetical protein
MGTATSVHSGSGEAELVLSGSGEAEPLLQGSNEAELAPSGSGEVAHTPRLGLMLGHRCSFSRWAIHGYVASRLGRAAQFGRAKAL